MTGEYALHVGGMYARRAGREEAAEMYAEHEGDDGTPGVDETGYPHDGGDCTDTCWTPQEPRKPELSSAERMEALRKAAAAQRAAMTPVQRALDDAATDLMLYGEAFIPVGAGTIIGELLKPTPLSEQSGPPWTHTFSVKPPCDIADCCEADGPCGCNCHKIQATHTITLLEDVLAKHPDGEEIARAVTGNLVRAAVGYSKVLEPVNAPRPAQFLSGCHKTDGSWVHGRPHSCPKWARG